jgi:hypothetical protein
VHAIPRAYGPFSRIRAGRSSRKITFAGISGGRLHRRLWVQRFTTVDNSDISQILFTKSLVCYTGVMTAEERIASLEEQLTQALEQLRVTQEELAVASQRIEELEKQKMPVMAT